MLKPAILYKDEIRQKMLEYMYTDDMMYYSERMDMVERAAYEADATLANYILKAVTKGYSYEYLKSKLEIPCCREVYYQLYRKFFWILNVARK